LSLPDLSATSTYRRARAKTPGRFRPGVFGYWTYSAAPQKTVASHLQSVLAKLGVHSRAEAIAIAYKEGFVDTLAQAIHA
jgi:Bacterial regulatory proteins, luxR family